MRIFATWTFESFYLVLHWTDIQFSNFPNIFFWSEWLPVYIKSIHTSLSPRLGIFQVNNSHPYEAPPTIPLTVRLLFGVFKNDSKKYAVVSCTSESFARSPLFDKVIQALSADHIHVTVKMLQLGTDCFYRQMQKQILNKHHFDFLRHSPPSRIQCQIYVWSIP